MFRKLCFVALIILVNEAANGQGISLGIHFNPTVSWLKSDVEDIIPQKLNLGFDLGLAVDNYFARNYAFATGASLFYIGGSLKYVNGKTLSTNDGNKTIDNGGEVKYGVRYIKIPVALKFKTHMIGRMIYTANLGFDPMVRIFANADMGGDNKNLRVNDEIRFFNIGWHIGLGTHYSLGGDASIYTGLTFLNTFLDLTKSTSERINTNNLLLCIGIMF